MSDKKLKLVITNDSEALELENYTPFAIAYLKEPEVKEIYNIRIQKHAEVPGIALIGMGHSGGMALVEALAVQKATVSVVLDTDRFDQALDGLGAEIKASDLAKIGGDVTIDGNAVQVLNEAFISGINVQIVKHARYTLFARDIEHLAGEIMKLTARKVEQMEYEIVERAKKPMYPELKCVTDKRFPTNYQKRQHHLPTGRSFYRRVGS